MKIQKSLIFLSLLFIASTFLFGRWAVGADGSSDWQGIDLTIQNVGQIIAGFACWLWSLSVPLMVIFIIWSGLRYMYAGADPGKVGKAKENFKYVIIGSFVILAAFTIIYSVANLIGVDLSFVPFTCSF